MIRFRYAPESAARPLVRTARARTPEESSTTRQLTPITVLRVCQKRYFNRHTRRTRRTALRADALRAQDWAGEPFLHDGEDTAEVLAPGTARRAALDEALAEIEAGRSTPTSRWKVRFGFLLGLERVLSSKPPDDRRRHRAAQAPDRRARRDADRADRRQPAPRRGRGERQRARRRRGRRARRCRGGGRGRRGRRRHRARRRRAGGLRRRGSRRDSPLPLPPSDRVGQDDRGRGLRRGGALARDPDPHPPPPARLPVPARPDHRGLRRAVHRLHRAGQGAAARRPDHDPDLRLVRPARRLALARGLPARDLRRGAHGARREDERGDPQLPGADLHRHDGDRAADREAGLGRLPRLGRRPPARGRRPARPDRAAALPARSAGRGDQLGADRRRRLRGARPRGRARPPGSEPGRGEPLPRAVRHDARDRLRRRRRPRVQPRPGVPRRRAEGGGGLGPHAAGQAGRDARLVRARRDQRPDQRDAARRGLELAARDRVHAPRADRLEARLPAADRPDHADAPAQGGRDRRRLHAEVGHAQRPRRLAPLAARSRLLPRGSARHAGAAPPRPAPRPPQALAGDLARPGHRGRLAPARGDPARVAADRPEVPGRGRAALLGDDRRTAAPLRPAGGVREEVRRELARPRPRSRRSSPSAPPRTRTGGCG